MAELLQQVVFPLGAVGGSVTARATRRLDSGGPFMPPTDPDSNLDLVRIEDEPRPLHTLIWDPAVDRQVRQLVAERKGLLRLQENGLSAPKSVLFCGPPGVGKTESAREVAAALGLPLVILDLATILSSLLGKSGNNLRQVFQYAKRTPCVLLLDEIDAIAKRRDDSGDIGELKRLVTVLLQEIDLWPSTHLMIAATNHVQLLDTAVIRRFEQTINFPRPDALQLSALGNSLGSNGSAKMPAGWTTLLAEVLADTSYSDFVRDLNKVRRSAVLGGQKEGASAIKEIVQEKIDAMSKEARKRVAVSLVQDVKLPQREASRITKIARDTLKSALQGVSRDGGTDEVPVGLG
ncbi:MULTISPECIES: ATP-binding protein [unclassified Stenotrophomonas]|uniref:AAA family ATPase n=1 Tax=unclassified Stenotrophomonas TaxID=196198 RepID=UPI002118C57F|nr:MULTISPECIES: ATP-binding protein [unclassified Stenotrophomonas]